MDISINYFKNNIFPNIRDYYKINFSTSVEGDITGFGNLERVEIEGNNLLGGIDFWSSGWIDFHLIDLRNDKEILNILVSPDRNKEKTMILEDFERTLIIFSNINCSGK